MQCRHEILDGGWGCWHVADPWMLQGVCTGVSNNAVVQGIRSAAQLAEPSGSAACQPKTIDQTLQARLTLIPSVSGPALHSMAMQILRTPQPVSQTMPDPGTVPQNPAEQQPARAAPVSAGPCCSKRQVPNPLLRLSPARITSLGAGCQQLSSQAGVQACGTGWWASSSQVGTSTSSLGPGYQQFDTSEF